MIPQSQFEREQAALWRAYRNALDVLERSGRAGKLHSFPRQFQRICTHYALARSRGYSPGLVEALNDLVQRGYRQLYRKRIPWLATTLDFLRGEFPRTLRRHRSLFYLSAALLFGPLLAMGWATYENGTLVYSLLEADQVAELESMYDPANREPGRPREADTDFAQFGFYILNNVRIAFQLFAGGLFLGLGSLFFLSFNGLVFGAVAGYLTQLGYGESFWTFVSSHAPLELTAILIAGTAGLLLARALLAPGRRRRLHALQANAREGVKLIVGAMVMLILAALIEAFWSGSPLPKALKLGFGLLWWVLLLLYFSRAGRPDEG